MLEVTPVSGESPDLQAQRLEELRRLVPEAFTSGTLDAARLAEVLGIDSSGEERYRLSWTGRERSLKLAQGTSTAALLPERERSTKWDSAPHAFIEADNLEALRVLQRSYARQVKLIYIDPPYNTGRDFIYKDNFRSSKADHLAATGQVGAEGGKLVPNLVTGGRYHSDWLLMMYPRLTLARNLLTDDGLLFVSIDDNEVHNLRLLLDEVFGPENFMATMVWNRGHSQQQGVISEYHEYVLVYAKRKAEVSNFKATRSEDILAGAMKKVSRSNPKSEFTFPAGVRCDAEDGTEFVGEWGDAEKVELVSGRFRVQDGRTTEEMTLAAGWTQKNQMTALLAKKTPVLDTRGQEVLEFFFNSNGKLKVRKERAAYTPPTVQDWGTQSTASTAMSTLMGAQLFDRPKPVLLVQDIVGWVTSGEDIVLDFFAGSGTTGHAVMAQNAVDGEKRRYICVTLPEAIPQEEEAAKLGYETISDVCLARLKKADSQVNGVGAEAGIRVFRLGRSNFKIWDSEAAAYNAKESASPEAQLQEQLDLFAKSLEGDVDPESIAWELLVKCGVKLDTQVELRADMGPAVYATPDGATVVCAGGQASPALVAALVQAKPRQIILLDEMFDGDDALKQNAMLSFDRAGVTSIRTV